MTEGEKLHRLLKFIVKTGLNTYEYDELIPAFKYGIFKKPNAKEIERLCSMLIFDGLVLNSPGKKSGGISIKPQAIEAYYGGKYFEEKEEEGYSSSAILGAVVIGGAVAGGLLWLGYLSYDRGEKLKSAEKRIQTAEQLDQKRLRQIESLSAGRDSLQNHVNTMQTQIEYLKRPALKEPVKVKRRKK